MSSATDPRPPVPAEWLITKSDHEAAARGYWFDPEPGLKAIRFIEKFCRHTQGDEWVGQPFLLSDWQKSFIMRLLGWKRPDGLRRFRRFLILLPKKNGKSTFMASLCLYMAISEAGAVVCQAARDVKQGMLIHEECRRQIELSPALGRALKVDRSKNQIKERGKGRFGVIHLLSSDARSADGKNASFTVIDELHQFTDDKMYLTLRQAGRGRAGAPKPLQIPGELAANSSHRVRRVGVSS